MGKKKNNNEPNVEITREGDKICIGTDCFTITGSPEDGIEIQMKEDGSCPIEVAQAYAEILSEAVGEGKKVSFVSPAEITAKAKTISNGDEDLDEDLPTKD